LGLKRQRFSGLQLLRHLKKAFLKTKPEGLEEVFERLVPEVEIK